MARIVRVGVLVALLISAGPSLGQSGGSQNVSPSSVGGASAFSVADDKASEIADLRSEIESLQSRIELLEDSLNLRVPNTVEKLDCSSSSFGTVQTSGHWMFMVSCEESSPSWKGSGLL